MISVKATLELEKLDGENALIKSTSSQIAKEQMVQFPGMQRASKLKSLNASGTGEMKINFNEFLPQGSTDSTTSITMEIQGQGGQSTEVETNMAMRVKITD